MGYSEDEFGFSLWDLLNKSREELGHRVLERQDNRGLETTEVRIGFLVDSHYYRLKTNRPYTVD